MIDIKPYIAEILKDIAPVELSFNENFRTLPVILITETENDARVVINNTDRISRIVIQLDVYGEKAESTEKMAVSINNALTEKGFRAARADQPRV